MKVIQIKLLIDPHTAVAIGAAKKVSLSDKTLILSTAHPSKFFDVVMQETNTKPELPENLKDITIKKEKYDILSKDLKNIKKYILERS